METRTPQAIAAFIDVVVGFRSDYEGWKHAVPEVVLRRLLAISVLEVTMRDGN
uniref:hypothetical protein n=1 Tax=Fervidobacterium ngatamarikiense TaxID=3389972 RepID=UPI000A8CF63D